MPNHTCTFDGCAKPVSAVSLCAGHYWQMRKGRDLTPLRPQRSRSAPAPKCSFPACGRPVRRNGLCDSHDHQRLRGIELRPLKADWTVEDRLFRWRKIDDNGCWVWTGTGTANYGLVTASLPGKPKKKTYLVHRLAFEHWVGPIPDGETIHHKCNVRACFNPEHLELASHRENLGEMFARKAFLAKIATLEAEVAGLRQQLNTE